MKIKNEISAGGIVYKKVQSLLWLICQHSQHKGWVFPKGLVGDNDSTESMETAALREVKEEGGVEARIVNPQPVKVGYEYSFRGNLINKTVYYFLMEYVSGDPKNHDREMSQAKFISEEAVKKQLTYPSDRQAFKKALDFLK